MQADKKTSGCSFSTKDQIPFFFPFITLADPNDMQFFHGIPLMKMKSSLITRSKIFSFEKHVNINRMQIVEEITEKIKFKESLTLYNLIFNTEKNEIVLNRNDEIYGISTLLRGQGTNLVK
ncbi:hypothetical protein CHS0354_037834 [Potamilus streckersoni]|uniref:Uncharacterized protein n=1 Tax=Potamilus streckersoni TaxID=2493646 RepID=A0AAE0SJ40_9BIVA|nr:hypothetical protein CHS0354_037834 [Potamilus streckersoni]